MEVPIKRRGKSLADRIAELTGPRPAAGTSLFHICFPAGPGFSLGVVGRASPSLLFPCEYVGFVEGDRMIVDSW